MDGYTNTELHIARFLSAADTATPEDEVSAPIFHDDPSQTFLDALRTYSQLEQATERSDYFSLSRWSGGHTQYHHEGTTCLTLEYDVDHAPAVKGVLEELEISHYVIPTKAGRSRAFLFAIPCVDELDHTDTTRAASIFAEMIEQGGLFENSYLSTYFFRFRPDQEITFTPGKLVSSSFVREANNNRVVTNIKRWLR